MVCMKNFFEKSDIILQNLVVNRTILPNVFEKNSKKFWRVVLKNTCLAHSRCHFLRLLFFCRFVNVNSDSEFLRSSRRWILIYVKFPVNPTLHGMLESPEPNSFINYIRFRNTWLLTWISNDKLFELWLLFIRVKYFPHDMKVIMW